MGSGCWATPMFFVVFFQLLERYEARHGAGVQRRLLGAPPADFLAARPTLFRVDVHQDGPVVSLVRGASPQPQVLLAETLFYRWKFGFFFKFCYFFLTGFEYLGFFFGIAVASIRFSKLFLFDPIWHRLGPVFDDDVPMSLERVFTEFLPSFRSTLVVFWDLYGIDSISKGFTRDGTDLNCYS